MHLKEKTTKNDLKLQRKIIIKKKQQKKTIAIKKN